MSYVWRQADERNSMSMVLGIGLGAMKGSVGCATGRRRTRLTSCSARAVLSTPTCSRTILILQLERAAPLSHLDYLHTRVLRRENSLAGPTQLDCYRTVAWLMDEERVKFVLQFVKAAFRIRKKSVRLANPSRPA